MINSDPWVLISIILLILSVVIAIFPHITHTPKAKITKQIGSPWFIFTIFIIIIIIVYQLLKS